MKKESWFRKTERMLYDYKTLDATIRVLEAERASLAGPYDEDFMPQTSTSVVKIGQGSTRTLFDTSQTERWGIRRAEIALARIDRIDRKLLELRRWRDGIREARQNLTEDERSFIWLRYDLEKPHFEVRAALRQKVVSMSESTYFRLRRGVLEKIYNFMEGIK